MQATEMGTRKKAKRLLDQLGAAAILAVTAPALAVAGAAIRVQGDGPVLFTQERIGRYGRPFRLYKLRTLRSGNHAQGRPPDGELLAQLGKYRRASSLDELTQVFNVLNDDKSLVGPRRLLPQHLPPYTPEQARRHAVLPGTTGWRWAPRAAQLLCPDGRPTILTTVRPHAHAEGRTRINFRRPKGGCEDYSVRRDNFPTKGMGAAPSRSAPSRTRIRPGGQQRARPQAPLAIPTWMRSGKSRSARRSTTASGQAAESPHLERTSATTPSKNPTDGQKHRLCPRHRGAARRASPFGASKDAARPVARPRPLTPGYAGIQRD